MRKECDHANIDYIELYCSDCDHYVCWDCRVNETEDDLTQCTECRKDYGNGYEDEEFDLIEAE